MGVKMTTTTIEATFRLAETSDFEIIREWYAKRGMVMDDDFNPADFLPVDSTFIMEIDGRPAYCVPIFLTNANRVYLDDLISDPDLTKEKRQGALAEFQKFVEKWVADKGFDLIYGEVEHGTKLFDLYKSLGYITVKSNNFVPCSTS